jgi:hypothetical protein
MSGPVSSWMVGLGLCAAALAQCSIREASAQASRPVDEMRGNCNAYALDVRKELAAMADILGKLTALTSRGTAPPMIPIGQSLLVTLHHTDQVTLVVTPKRSGPYAGLLAFSVPADGRYRISAGSAVWIDVVEGQVREEPTQFEMQTGCVTLFKTIQYRLKKGADYWIELSGNTAAVTLLLSSETR